MTHYCNINVLQDSVIAFDEEEESIIRSDILIKQSDIRATQETVEVIYTKGRGKFLYSAVSSP